MATENKKMKMMTLDQMKENDIGKVGTVERDKYEFELRMEVLGKYDKVSAKRTEFNPRTTWGINRGSKISNLEIGTKY